VHFKLQWGGKQVEIREDAERVPCTKALAPELSLSMR